MTKPKSTSKQLRAKKKLKKVSEKQLTIEQEFGIISTVKRGTKPLK